MIGLFPDATASYARFIAARLGSGVTVEPLTISALERDPEARARANSADLAVTFVNRQREVMSLVPNTKVVSISFIPSEETRKSLAALDSLARVAVISRLPDFLPIMKAGVQRFAPHVAHLTGATLETPDLEPCSASPTSSCLPAAPRTCWRGCGRALPRSNTGMRPTRPRSSGFWCR